MGCDLPRCGHALVALRQWQRALELFGELGTPEAAALGALLAEDPTPTGAGPHRRPEARAPRLTARPMSRRPRGADLL